jgi:tetratricopeptide (TPR) repeat protein
MVAKAMVLLDRSRFDDALRLLPEAERLAQDQDPQTLASIRRMTALCHYSLGQFADAERAYRGVLDLLPDDVESLNNLAFLLAKELDRSSDALPLAERAVALLETPQASVLDTLGIVQFLNGDLEDARATLEEALLLDPRLAAIHLHLAQVYHALDLDTKATQSLQEAIELAMSSGDRQTEAQAREFLEQWP